MTKMLTIIGLLAISSTALADKKTVITCDEKAATNFQKERLELGGKKVVIKQIDDGWLFIRSSNDNADIQPIVNTDLETCQVDYQVGESAPPQYFLTGLKCQGDLMNADGPKTSLDLVFKNPNSAWHVALVIKTTSNVFGEIKQSESAEDFDRCFLQFE